MDVFQYLSIYPPSPETMVARLVQVIAVVVSGNDHHPELNFGDVSRDGPIADAKASSKAKILVLEANPRKT